MGFAPVVDHRVRAALQFNIEMEDIKEIEQRVLNTLGMSKARWKQSCGCQNPALTLGFPCAKVPQTRHTREDRHLYGCGIPKCTLSTTIAGTLECFAGQEVLSYTFAAAAALICFCGCSGDRSTTALDSLQSGYKKLVILMRAVYTQTRQLPLWAQRRTVRQIPVFRVPGL